jgi:hypothetical protein
MKKIKYIILIVLLSMITAISGIYAFQSYEIAIVENNIVSGAVNIELKEYIKDSNNNEIEIDSLNKKVLPSESIPFIVKVYNKGISSYLRVKYEYENASFSDGDINIDDTNWIKKGEYYYYKNVLDESDYVELFNRYTTPSNILGTYNFIITAEAVQSEYFNIDFESDTPWGDFVVEEAIDENYDISTISVSNNTIVDYKDDGDNYLEIPQNFMQKIYLLRPGDKISDYITVNNISDKQIEIFMKNVNLSPQLNENYKYLTLKVYDEKNNIVYDGKVLQEALTSLGRYEPGSSNKLTFEVEFLKENENITSIKDYKIGWKYYLSEIEEEPSIIDIINPKTGDGIFIWIAIFIASLCTLIVIIKRLYLLMKKVD